MTAGLAQARAPRVVVMDADLQHPPEVVPELLAAVRQTVNERAVDAVVASRYRGQGSSAGLAGWVRRVVSRRPERGPAPCFPCACGPSPTR